MDFGSEQVFSVCLALFSFFVEKSADDVHHICSLILLWLTTL